MYEYEFWILNKLYVINLDYIHIQYMSYHIHLFQWLMEQINFENVYFIFYGCVTYYHFQQKGAAQVL